MSRGGFANCPPLGAGLCGQSGQRTHEHWATCSRQVPPASGSWTQSRHFSSMARRRLIGYQRRYVPTRAVLGTLEHIGAMPLRTRQRRRAAISSASLERSMATRPAVVRNRLPMMARALALSAARSAAATDTGECSSAAIGTASRCTPHRLACLLCRPSCELVTQVRQPLRCGKGSGPLALSLGEHQCTERPGRAACGERFHRLGNFTGAARAPVGCVRHASAHGEQLSTPGCTRRSAGSSAPQSQQRRVIATAQGWQGQRPEDGWAAC
jgi:hypothetical protein